MDGFALRSVDTDGLNMNRSDDTVTIGSADKIVGILRDVMDIYDTDDWGTVGLKWSRIIFRISEPGQVRAVELDMFNSQMEGIVLGVSGIDGDCGLLDMADDVEGSIRLANAERDGKLATGISLVNSTGGIGRGAEDRSISSMVGGGIGKRGS